MLTPEQIRALEDVAERIFDPVSNWLIEDIARRVSEAGQLTSTAAYQVWLAQQQGRSQREVKAKVAELLEKSTDEVAALMRQAAKTGYRYDLERLATAEAVAFEDNLAIQTLVQAIERQTRGDLSNLTQTIGFVSPAGQALPLTNAYLEAANFAFTQTATGALDYNTAVRRATAKLTDRGIVTIDYASGMSTEMWAAVRRDVFGAMGLMQEQISKQNFADLGADGWEISAHLNSAPDHEPIQGKQYTDADYQALNASLVRRIGTLNCGHAAFPILYGISPPVYSAKELAEMRRKNADGFEYRGKHYTGYEATQKQREIERAIRRQKRRLLVDETTGDEEKYTTDAIRLRRLREEYARFSQAAGLPTQNERIQQVGFGSEQAERATATALRTTKISL